MVRQGGKKEKRKGGRGQEEKKKRKEGGNGHFGRSQRNARTVAFSENYSMTSCQASKTLPTSPECGHQQSSGALRMARGFQGQWTRGHRSSGTPARVVFHWVVAAGESPQAGVTGAAISQDWSCWGCLLHLQVHKRMCVFYKQSECLMFLIDGPSVAQLLGSD